MARSNQAVRAVRIAAMSVAFTLLWAGGNPLVAAAFQGPQQGPYSPDGGRSCVVCCCLYVRCLEPSARHGAYPTKHRGGRLKMVGAGSGLDRNDYRLLQRGIGQLEELTEQLERLNENLEARDDDAEGSSDDDG